MSDFGPQYYVYGDKKVSGGGSGGGLTINDVNQRKDLSSQIDGFTDTFDVGEIYANLRVYHNGVYVNRDILLQSGTTFKLGFVPRFFASKNKLLEVVYDKPPSP